MQITVEVNKNVLAKKLQALYDYVVYLQVLRTLDFIIIGDKHGTEKIAIKYTEIKGNIIKDALISKIDRREFTKKLKAMTENNVRLTISSTHSLIIIDGINTKEQSTYYCYNNPTEKPKVELQEPNTAFNFFKKILDII